MNLTKTQFVSDLKEGENIDAIFAVKGKSSPIQYKNGKNGSWFSLQLTDRTGEINAKFWGTDEIKTQVIWDSFEIGDVIQIKGTVIKYNGSIQVSITDTIKKVENYNIDDFVQHSKRDIPEMVSELRNHLSEIKDPHISSLVNSFLEDEQFMKKFSLCPAATSIHHNYLGGLLEHTLNLIRICLTITKNHPELDKDLLLAGCFLHDCGKIREYQVSTIIGVTEEGNLIGHIVIGQQMVEEKISKINGFTEELRLKLIHMILSHHGKMEWGSPKEPQFPEAMAVHLADQMDAKLDVVINKEKNIVR